MHVYYASCALALNFVNFYFYLLASFAYSSHTLRSLGPTARAARTKTRYRSSTRNARTDLENARRSCEEQYSEYVADFLQISWLKSFFIFSR